MYKNFLMLVVLLCGCGDASVSSNGKIDAGSEASDPVQCVYLEAGCPWWGEAGPVEEPYQAGGGASSRLPPNTGKRQE
jgi:hypothetical protein